MRILLFNHECMIVFVILSQGGPWAILQLAAESELHKGLIKMRDFHGLAFYRFG